MQDDADPRTANRTGSIWLGTADGSLQLWRWRRPLPHLHGSARLAEAAGPAVVHPPASASRDLEAHPLAMATYVPTPSPKGSGGSKAKVEEFEREEVAAPATAEVVISDTISWLQTTANDAAHTARQQWQQAQGW